jgi:hypothetical protein
MPCVVATPRTKNQQNAAVLSNCAAPKFAKLYLFHSCELGYSAAVQEMISCFIFPPDLSKKHHRKIYDAIYFAIYRPG